MKNLNGLICICIPKNDIMFNEMEFWPIAAVWYLFFLVYLYTDSSISVTYMSSLCVVLFTDLFPCLMFTTIYMQIQLPGCAPADRARTLRVFSMFQIFKYNCKRW